MAVTITRTGKLRFGGAVHTITADASGGTSDWVEVSKAGAGVDIKNIGTGTAYMESTCCAPDNLANALATKWGKGDVAASAGAHDEVTGVSHVRLVATGAAQASVRT